MNGQFFMATMAVSLAATCAQARFIYTETQAPAGKTDGKGTLTDGIWLLNATRKNNTFDLAVNGSQGNFLGSAPCPLNLTEIYSEDGETQYHAVSFETLSHHNGASKSTLYEYREMITEFIAPDCQKTAGAGCFKNCTALTNVQLNAVVTSLGGDRPFIGCSNLEKFYPRTLTIKTLTSETFSGCSKLGGSFNLPDCESIVGKAFSGCAKIEEVSAPKVTVVKGSVFAGCASLTNVVLSPNLSSMENYAFQNCASLNSDVIHALLSKDLIRLGSEDISNQLGVFTGCESLSGSIDWNYPNMITNVVGGNMFNGCTSLTRVNFITDVAEIRYGAFANIGEGAELHMPLKAPAIYGNDAISRGTAPYPKVFLKGNFEDWFEVMQTKNHLIIREDFNNTSWSHKYDNDTKYWETITTLMARDAAMCTKVKVGNVSTVTVPDKKVIGFIMRGNNTGCWVLEESESKRGTIIIVK